MGSRRITHQEILQESTEEEKEEEEEEEEEEEKEEKDSLDEGDTSTLEEEELHDSTPRDKQSFTTADWGKKSNAYYGDPLSEDNNSEDEENEQLMKEEEKYMEVGGCTKTRRQLEEDEAEALHIKMADHIGSIEISDGGSQQDSDREEPLQDFKHEPKNIANPLQLQKDSQDFEESLSSIVSSLRIASTSSWLSPELILSAPLATSAPSLCDLPTADRTELSDMLLEMSRILDEVNAGLSPLKKEQKDAEESGLGLSFLSERNSLFLQYLRYLAYFICLKCHGVQMSVHPVIPSLMELKVLMDKIKPIENRLKYPIQRLMQMTPVDARSRPNPDKLITPKEEEKEDDASGRRSKPSKRRLLIQGSDSEIAAKEDCAKNERTTPVVGVYKPKKLLAVEYTQDHVKEQEKARNDMERQKKRLKRTALMKAMREQVNGADERPEELGGVVYDGRNKKMERYHQEAEERQQFEEDRMFRLATNKSDRTRHKRLLKPSENGLKQLGATLDDILDFADEAVEDGATRGLDNYLNAHAKAKDLSQQAEDVEKSVKFREAKKKSSRKAEQIYGQTYHQRTAVRRENTQLWVVRRTPLR